MGPVTHELGDKDSNLDKRSQNPLSCHWTIPQVTVTTMQTPVFRHA
jgi:hypothetical protein